MSIWPQSERLLFTDCAIVSCVCVCVAAGHSWQEKVSDVRKKMEAQSATSLVVTAMDEIACE